MWITGGECRVLVKTDEGHVIDTNNEWNNRLSAEVWLYTWYPGTKVRFETDERKVRDLNREWSACVTGN
jgi:hypothetical protein